MEVSYSQCTDGGNWSELPEVSLRQVFRWLGDQDRVRAAMVCKCWYHVMHSPALWRSRTFTFCGRPSKYRRAEYESAIWYAKKFGRYLVNCEIKFMNPYNSLLTRRFQITMRSFLARLGNENNRLKSFTIQHLELDRLVWSSSVRNAFLKSLNFFLRRECKHLQSFNLRGARLGMEQGFSILNSLVHLRQRSSISELNIEDFFSHHLAIYANPTFPKIMRSFCVLTSLSLNYNCISDDLLDTLSDSCSQTLRIMNIKCHIHDPHSQVIWGLSWSLLAKRATSLKVNFYFDLVMRNDRLTRILVPEIPVRSLNFRSCYFSDPDWTMKPTLVDLIPHYKNTLQKLTLEFNNSHERIDDELLQLVLMCDRLHYMKIWAFLSIRFIETMLQYRQEGKSNCRTLKVRIYMHKYETSEEDKMLRDLYMKYRDLIDTELNYLVITYPLM
ncbi:F-box only protein 39 [Callorhinchus milii]|uniref:F-box protein 39 n=1 Tax=Callorhinchus milii TaxID=7868 RepID=A0A4W3JLJ1_CALMI|nr:F-box only protein 39 [Callorhinchus milii]|eukprot:gi/632972147/ref/XP_007902517.1/ PREDICTED: F-box only protein 39 [Callorhinchus milii]